MAQNTTLPTILPFLQEHIKDSQWEVRRAVVDSLCNIINSFFDQVPDDCIRLLGERALDRRSAVRKYAITGLTNVGVGIRGYAQIVAIHLSDAWNAHKRPSSSLSSKLGFVVAVLLRCYGVSEDDTRNRCSRLLNEIFISNCADEEGDPLSLLSRRSCRCGVHMAF